MGLHAKQAESDFDDLLGQLTDELAMTPPSDSGVALVLEPEPQKIQVESTARMAGEAAAGAAVMQPQVSKPDNTMVKVVGIIAASLTVVSLAALVMFGRADTAVEPAPEVDAAAVAQDERDAGELHAAQRRTEQHARELAIKAERAADQAEFARIEAAHLAAQLAAKVEAKSKPTRRSKPKPKPKPNPGDDFDSL